ncbi:MAG: 3-deoxy-8-phosphooctulonate synthase [Endomicrobium sp.]|jgi:2-dehydro-3-deoxyphosphooctonate aldolase (KDO 8-P synthase)|nr:3-deoxy-8-phosphooctulonate synthase [Endomicrobium sp.]
MYNKTVKINKNIVISNDNPIVIIAGPCVLESEKCSLRLATKLKQITDKLNINFIFKASYDKANRSSYQYYRGPGLEKGLKLLSKIKKELNLSIITDVHAYDQVNKVAEIVDILQIPAYLSRQTDLITACSLTGKPINIKKGQFLAPDDMFHVIHKSEINGNCNLLLTERGTCFGYHNLIVDFRGIEIMKQTGYPVVFDATHSVQYPGNCKNENYSGGDRNFVLPLSKAAVAMRIAALVLEVHEEPDRALSDGAASINIQNFTYILKIVKMIDELIKNN